MERIALRRLNELDSTASRSYDQNELMNKDENRKDLVLGRKRHIDKIQDLMNNEKGDIKNRPAE